MGKIKTYDFKKVDLIIALPESGTPYYVSGFANNSNISAEKKSDKYTPHVGAKGDTTYAKNNDNSGIIKFKTKTDSPSNRTLQSLADGDFTFDVMINDSNDTTKSTCKANDCVIQKPANYERGENIGDEEWTIACPAISIDYGTVEQ